MAVSQADLLRITAVQKYGGIDDVVNRFHFVVVTPPNPNTDLALLEDIGNLLSLAWQQIESSIPGGLEPDHIEVYNVTEDAPHGLGSWGAAYTGGTGTSDAMPLDDCALVLYSTSRKRVQGRTYLSPFIEAAHADSRWSGTLRVDINNWATTLMEEDTMANGGVYRFGVWSQTHGLFLPPTRTRVQEIVAQQERRRIGRGS